MYSQYFGVFKTLFSKQLKRSDRQSSKSKFERCTCPNDLKRMAGELLTLKTNLIIENMIKIHTKPMFEFPRVRYTGQQGIRNYKLPSLDFRPKEVRIEPSMVSFGED